MALSAFSSRRMRPKSITPPRVVAGTHDLEPYGSPFRDNVCMHVRANRLFVAGSFTTLLGYHHLCVANLALSGATRSAHALRVDAPVAALAVLTDARVAVVLADDSRQLKLLDVPGACVCAEVPEVRDVHALLAVDVDAVLALCAESVAFVVTFDERHVHTVRRVPVPVSSGAACARSRRLVTVHRARGCVLDLDELRVLSSFETGLSSTLCNLRLNRSWLVLHDGEKHVLRVFDCETLRLARVLSVRANQQRSFCLRLVGDLVMWNSTLDFVTMEMMDVRSGVLLWRATYTAIGAFGIVDRLPPFVVLSNGDFLAQTSDYLFERYRLPAAVARIVQENMREEAAHVS